MIHFTCGKCGTPVNVPDEHAGKQGVCPNCKAVVQIPSAPAAQDARAPDAGRDAPPPGAPTPPVPGRPGWAPGMLPPAPVAQGGRGLAICALVFGILAIIPFLGLALGLTAIILAVVALAKKTPGMGMAIVGLVLGVVLAFLGTTIGASLLLPSLGRARELARQSLCQANLKSIGAAIAEYSAENDHRYPPDLDTLVKAGLISRPALKCPSARSGRECDYIYFPCDDRAPDGTMVACDREANHRDYRSVLFHSGSVRGMSERAFQDALREEPNRKFAEHLREEEGP